MKRPIIALCFALVIAMLLSFAVFAHSGNTDAQGGHHVSGTNNYHYHHGYPAHQHENGLCPYESAGNTGDTYGNDSHFWVIGGTSAAMLILLVAFLIKRIKKAFENHFDTIGAVSVVIVSISAVTLLLLLFLSIIIGDFENLLIAVVINIILLISSILILRYCNKSERKRAIETLPDYTMYYTQHGKCYHSRKECALLTRSASIQSGTREANYAPLLQRKPCPRCCGKDVVTDSAHKDSK